jgi:amino-acid N-acetyltransferase
MKVDMSETMTITIAPADATDTPAILALLERNGLPRDGFPDQARTALAARAGASVVGSAALELYGMAALLRSVAVDASLRGQGLGQQLTRAALELARQHGVKTVYLLTETAGDFFPRFGFRPIERSTVDPAVQQSVEFTSACPVSALVLALSLASVSDTPPAGDIA